MGKTIVEDTLVAMKESARTSQKHDGMRAASHGTPQQPASKIAHVQGAGHHQVDGGGTSEQEQPRTAAVQARSDFSVAKGGRWMEQQAADIDFEDPLIWCVHGSPGTSNI